MEKFIINPNLPESKVSLVILDARARKSLINSLSNMGVDIIFSKHCSDLYDAVSYHPDMLIHHLGGKDIVAAPNAPLDMLNALKMHGFNIIKGENYVTNKYPKSIAYNAARIGRYAVCNAKHTDPVLIKNLLDREVEIIDVKQGYSKCSISILTEKAVITSDEGIYRELLKFDFDILKIQPGFIKLTGLNYGFIGGASGLIDKNKLAFAGCLKKHADYDEIKKFLHKYSIEAVELDDEELFDLGSIIPLKEVYLV